ncbi:hypothetical protein KUCAC02_021643, partial [Chaenocephalus aceratus]
LSVPTESFYLLSTIFLLESSRAELTETRRGVLAFRVRQKAETPSILDFFIRFLSSRMRFKRNGSYTLNRSSLVLLAQDMKEAMALH